MAVAYKYKTRQARNLKHAKRLHKLGKVGWSFVRTVILAGLCFMILYPLIVKFTSSIMHVDDMFDSSVRFCPRILLWNSIASPGSG